MEDNVISEKEIPIEKGIPLPVWPYQQSDLGKTIEKMEIGDSIVLPGYSMIQKAHQIMGRLGKKGKGRMIPESINIYRFWRIR